MYIDGFILFCIFAIVSTAIATMAVFMAEDQQEIRDLKRDLRIKHGHLLETQRLLVKSEQRCVGLSDEVYNQS